uniref:Uncharacterized protein n=4 Tax=unclassified bacterial viruses TaxID=12333 RepID=A0AAU6W3D0_9VIRU
MATFAVELRITDIEPFNRLIDVLSNHMNDLPVEVVTELRRICDRITEVEDAPDGQA